MQAIVSDLAAALGPWLEHPVPIALGGLILALTARPLWRRRPRSVWRWLLGGPRWRPRVVRQGPQRPGPWRPRVVRPAPAQSPAQASAPAPRPDLGDPNVQVRHVLAARFEVRRLMNRWEYGHYARLRDHLAARQPSFHVFPQVPMGAILATGCDLAFRSINAKRLDLLVVDSGGRPVAAIELQGSGHFQGDAMQRDRIKKEALRRAGIPLLEIYDGDDPDQLVRGLAVHLPPASHGTGTPPGTPQADPGPSSGPFEP